jgi:hypothetical protein
MPYIDCMDRASIIDDLASPNLSLSEVAARHGLTLDALSTYLTSDQARQKLDQIQSAAAIRTRLIAQLHLPVAAAALSTILQSHRAALTASPAQQASPLSPSNPLTRPVTPSVAQEQHDSSLGDNERHDEGPLPPSAASQPHQPPAAPHPTASTSQPPPIDQARDEAQDQARALRQQIELRRATTTLLRFANFNHRARSRNAEPPLARTASEQSPTVEPRHVNTASDPMHDSASHNHAQSFIPNPAPAAATYKPRVPIAASPHTALLSALALITGNRPSAASRLTNTAGALITRPP